MKHINKAKRRFLLTGKPELEAHGCTFGSRTSLVTFHGGCWALQAYDTRKAQVYFFLTRAQRERWIELNRATRSACGKRAPEVKAFRNSNNHGKGAS